MIGLVVCNGAKSNKMKKKIVRNETKFHSNEVLKMIFHCVDKMLYLFIYLC